MFLQAYELLADDEWTFLNWRTWIPQRAHFFLVSHSGIFFAGSLVVYNMRAVPFGCFVFKTWIFYTGSLSFSIGFISVRIILIWQRNLYLARGVIDPMKTCRHNIFTFQERPLPWTNGRLQKRWYLRNAKYSLGFEAKIFVVAVNQLQ